MRRPGQKNDDSFLPFVLARNPLARRGALRIWQYCRSSNYIGLLQIIRRHRVAAFGEAALQVGHDLGVAANRQPQRSSYGLAREIVLGWPETAHEQNNLSA